MSLYNATLRQTDKTASLRAPKQLMISSFIGTWTHIRLLFILNDLLEGGSLVMKKRVIGYRPESWGPFLIYFYT